MKISNLDMHTGQFVVVSDGPQDSTFPECWGSQARFSARAIGSSNDIAEAKFIADNWSGGAKIIDRATGKVVGKKRLAELTDA